MAETEGASQNGAFGRLLRQHRESAGLRQELLAERAGVSAPAISNLERGVNRPRLETVNLLAEALALTVEQRAVLLAAALPERTTAQSSSPTTAPVLPPGHNLPVPPTPLLGREREVAAVQARLQEPAARLLTLTGVGGVGKTRLALAVGAELVDHYPDGVWLVELAPLADPALVPSTVAGVLGLREESNQPLSSMLVDHLREQHLLLLLDNCEHLLAACADLTSTLLRACRCVSILVTSRERLGVSGEEIYQVPPLSVPDPHHLPPPEVVGSYEAVRLFVVRAQAQRREFALGERNAHAVVTICEQLDGIPLAIELAAARVNSLPVEAIAERLDERFRLLTMGPRDVLPRQQTLRATMDWSWDLLGEWEQTLLRRLSVFAGGWTLAVAEVVCAGEVIEGWAVLDLVDGLVSKSLVKVDHTDGEGARFRLLETVRQYGLERLTEVGELATMRDRHLDWCVDLAQDALPHLTSGEQGAWLVCLEREHDNVRAALKWSLLDAGDKAKGLWLVGSLWRFWNTRGYLSEGRGWLDAALADDQDAPLARATALEGAGVLAFEQSDYGRAVDLHEGALVLWRALGDRRGIATSLNNLGNVASVQGDYGRAAALHSESLALRRVLGERHGIAASLSNLGIVADLQGDYALAVTLHEEGLALRRELGDQQAVAKSLINLGIVAKKQGDYVWAAALYEEGLALQHALGDRRGIGASLLNLGIVAKKQGAYGRAVELLEESLALERELGDMKGIAVSLGSLGIVAFEQGDYQRAVALHEEALALCSTLGDRHGIAASLLNLGIVAKKQGDFGRAVELLKESLSLGREIGARDLVADGLESMAWVDAAREQPQRALQLAAAAEALRHILGVPLMPEQGDDHEQAVQVMRAAMGEEVFAAAWAEGRSLSFDEAVAFSLKDNGKGR